MVVLAAAAVVLGVVGRVGVGVGVGAGAAAAGVVVAAAVVVVVVVVVEEVKAEVEVAATAVADAAAAIESDFHIGICCGVTGFGYGSGMDRGMDRHTLSGPAVPLWLRRKRAGYF